MTAANLAASMSASESSMNVPPAGQKRALRDALELRS
jgi:hypothetical protein